MFYLLGWNHPLRSGLGDFMSSRDLLINRDLEYLGHLVCTLSAGHHTGDVATVIRLQLKMMILIINLMLCGQLHLNMFHLMKTVHYKLGIQKYLQLLHHRKRRKLMRIYQVK